MIKTEILNVNGNPVQGVLLNDRTDLQEGIYHVRLSESGSSNEVCRCGVRYRRKFF